MGGRCGTLGVSLVGRAFGILALVVRGVGGVCRWICGSEDAVASRCSGTVVQGLMWRESRRSQKALVRVTALHTFTHMGTMGLGPQLGATERHA